jgi:hypothetical protein
MSLFKPLVGTWTWDGTTTVLSDDTSGAQAGDFIQKSQMEGPALEIGTVNAGVSVVLLNPHHAVIPTGSGAVLSQQNVRNDIVAAPDVQCVETFEDITEPHAAPGTKRIIRQDYSSATVQVGKTYRMDWMYVHPPSDPAWGAVAGIEESIV